MKYSCFYFFGLADIPEVFAEVTACSSGNIHLVVVLVMALRAFPLKIIVNNNLSVVTTYLAIVRFGIKFGVLYIIIYVLDHFFKCREIMSEVRNLNI